MPFRDIASDEDPVRIAYLRFVEEAEGRGLRGCMFVVSLQGDPLEFCCTRVDLPTGPLWNLDLALRRAVAELTMALFQAGSLRPDAVFCLSAETPEEVFTEDIDAQVPLCRISVGLGGDSSGSTSGPGEGRSVSLRWQNDATPAIFVEGPLGRDLASRNRLIGTLRAGRSGTEGGFLRPMTIGGWVRRLVVNSLGRFALGRSQTGVERTGPLPVGPAILVQVTFPMVSRQPPGPVSHLFVDGVGTAETVRSFLFGGLPAASTPAYTGADGDTPTAAGGDPRSPEGMPWDRLHARLWRVLANPTQALLPGPDATVEWPGELLPFQLDGVRVLLESRRLLLADDMGLGKTLQVIVALRVLFLSGEIQSALVIAPAGVLTQWRRELLKWAPDLRAMVIRGSPSERGWQWNTPVQVAIVSYDTLRADFSESIHSPMGRRSWDVVVADEAQRIKNRNPTSQTVKGLRRQRSWALTGTPLENSEEELASIMEFVDAGTPDSPRRYGPGLALRQRHRELQLRRRKTEVLADLPPKTVAKLSVELAPAQRRSYDRAEREGIVHLRQLGRDVRVAHVLELISRLKQICNADPETGESSKFEDMQGRMEALTAGGNRAIVFSQYVTPEFGVDAAAEALRSFRPLTFTGSHSQDERRDIIDRFRRNDQHKALVVSLRAGGVGLNLQEASYVFHLDRWWNPAVERQAEDRAHRYGQTVPVHRVQVRLHRHNRGTHRPAAGAETGTVRRAGGRRVDGPVQGTHRPPAVWTLRTGGPTREHCVIPGRPSVEHARTVRRQHKSLCQDRRTVFGARLLPTI